MARVPYATKADSPVTAWLRNYWLLLSRCITAIGTRHSAGLDQSAQTGRAAQPQHPTAEQAGSEHGQKTGTNRTQKNDLES